MNRYRTQVTQMRIFLYYIKYLKPYMWRFLLALVITIPLGMMDGLIAWAIKPFMDGLIQQKPALDFRLLPLVIIGFNVVQGGLNYLSTYFNAYIGQNMMMDIQKDLYRKLLGYNLQWASQVNSGFVVNRLFNDPKQVQEVLLTNTRVLLSRIFSTISIGAVMFWIHWKLSLIALATLALIIIPISKVRKKIIRNNNMEAQDSARIISQLNATLSGKKIINSFNLQTQMCRNFAHALKDRYNKTMSMSKAQAALQPINYTITSVGIAIILFYGSHLILSNQITTGALVAFITALLMLYRPMRSIGHTAVTTQRLMAALRRVRRLLEARSFQDPDTSHLPKVGPLSNSIVVRDVSFRYRGRPDTILSHVDLTLKKGQMVALVGKSGSGKTTLAELILGLYALEKGQGMILYDGLPIDAISLDSLREQIGYVSQDTFLFDGTLRQNLLLGKLDATDEELFSALRRANLLDFVQELHHGLDTEIGERGVRLSGGQRQRLAIARAFLKNAPVLILDEATSSLDTQSEAAVQQALDDLMTNRTTLVIAHRLSTIQHAHRIVVMDNGHIVEEGSHQELLKHKGIYAQLFETQFALQSLDQESPATV